jgi:predicted O-methyltransferase YrrM
VNALLRKTSRMLREAGPRATVAKVVDYLVYRLQLAAAARRMRRRSARDATVQQGLDTAFGFAQGRISVAPVQIRSEIAGLLDVLAADPPSHVLEIGTARGGTLYLLSRVADPHARLASIDLPGGEFGGGYGDEWTSLLRELPRERQRVKLIRANSHDAGTLQEVRSWFGDDPLDFLLIDGDHRYEGVRTDFETYGPLVRPGGLIALHDIVPGAPDLVGGVPRFWEEVKRSHACEEIVRDWDQGGFGIGVVHVPNGVEKPSERLESYASMP